MAETPEEREARLDSEHAEITEELSGESVDLEASPKDRVEERERNKARDRKRRLGKPVDLSDAEIAGLRDPETDDHRESTDLAYNMEHSSRQRIELFTLMQEILIEEISEMDGITARFHRVL